MSYFSATKGFKSGGMNSLSLDAPFDQESLWSYELGYRYHSPEQKVRLDLTGFIYDYEDLQVTNFENNLAAIRNAASASLRGLELYTQVSFNPHWNLSGSIHYLEARYDNYQLSDSIDLSDNRMPFAPEWEGLISLYYLQELADGEASFGLAINYRDAIYFDDFEDSVMHEDGIYTLNLAANWQSRNKRWRLGFIAQNLNDEDYLQGAVRFTSTSAGVQGNALGYPAEGRTLALRIQYQLRD